MLCFWSGNSSDGNVDDPSMVSDKLNFTDEICLVQGFLEEKSV